MAGTRKGGLAAAITNKERFGEDFYVKIGAKGGKFGKADGTIKGFALLTPEQRRIAGAKGGAISRYDRKVIKEA